MNNRFKMTAIGLSIALTMPAYSSEMPSVEKMWEIIQQQQKTIEALKGNIQTTDEKVEMTAAAIDSSASGSSSKTSIGGYGELHYTNPDDGNSELDLHRFVLYFGHEFSDSLRFFSEFEIEHDIAGEGKVGEVEVEQAYVEKDITSKVSIRGGVFLMPVGIINETHEPPTFYGVERNPVEGGNIIPATWWEGGLGANIRFDSGVSLDFAYTSGLNLTTSTTAKKNFTTKYGRQKVGKAKANVGGLTARVKYTGVPGLELAATAYYQNNWDQSEAAGSGSINLIEAHGIYSLGDFTIKGLYASWNLDGSRVEAVGADEQTGYYIEPSYKITPSLGIFTRYNVWNYAAGSNGGADSKQLDIGVNYWLDEDVVLKADYAMDKDTGTNDVLNLGIGYQF